MPLGRVNSAGMPTVPIVVAGLELEAAIDTGYEGGLQLPLAWLSVLNPPPRAKTRYQLPNGQIIEEVTYSVPVRINGDELDADTYFSPNDDVLIGVEILRGYRLEINSFTGSVILDRVAP